MERLGADTAATLDRERAVIEDEKRAALATMRAEAAASKKAAGTMAEREVRVEALDSETGGKGGGGVRE